MRYLAAIGMLILAGCTTGSNHAAMQAYVGRTVGEIIIRNGPPESRVRIDASRVAYTFYFLRFPGGVTLECRFTFIAAERGEASTASRIVDFKDPGPACR